MIDNDPADGIQTANDCSDEDLEKGVVVRRPHAPGEHDRECNEDPEGPLTRILASDQKIGDDEDTECE